MKKLWILILSGILVLLSGCHKSDGGEQQPTADQSETSNVILPEEIFEFLDSKYTVTSRKEYNGISYETVFYIIDDKVSGVHSVITYPNEADAKAYFDEVENEYEYITLNGTAVDFYSDEEDYIYCYGDSFEKLKFSLKKSGYEVTVGFNEKEYFKKFPKDEH